MSDTEPANDNAASWRQLRAAIGEGSGDAPGAPWQKMARALVADLEGFGLMPLFRAACSKDRLVFTTAEHDLLASEPRVTLTFVIEDQTVRVAYSRADIEIKEPLIEAWVSAPVAVRVTLGALRRLWTETRPALPMPAELGERKPPASA